MLRAEGGAAAFGPFERNEKDAKAVLVITILGRHNFLGNVSKVIEKISLVFQRGS
jgi:hypothetical protein